MKRSPHSFISVLLMSMLFVSGASTSVSGEEPILPKLNSSDLGGGLPNLEVLAEEGEDLPRILRSTDGEAAPVSGFVINTANRREALLAYHRYYRPSDVSDTIMGWNGNVANCQAGTLSTAYHDAVLRRINYFRAQAGVSSDITFDSQKNSDCQAAALVIAHQDDLSHNLSVAFPDNPCLTPGADLAASRSNLARGSYGPESVNRLMMDDGQFNGPVGHRRWFLYPRAQEMGHGSIPFVTGFNSSCVIWVVGDFGAAVPAKPIAWPNAGYCPYEFIPGHDQRYPRWSFSYPGADFTNANVSVSFKGTLLDVELEPLSQGIGDNTLVWKPAGVPFGLPADGSDAVFHVTISGIAEAPFATFEYDVRDSTLSFFEILWLSKGQNVHR